MRLALRVALGASWGGCFLANRFWPEGQNSLPVLWSGISCALALFLYVISRSDVLTAITFRLTWTDALVVIWLAYRWVRDADLNFSTLLSPRYYTDIVLLVQYSCFRLACNYKQISWVVMALLAAATLQASSALLQLVGIVEGNNETWRVTGTFFNPAPLACYLVMSLCYAFSYLLEGVKSPTTRWLLYGCIGSCSTAVLATNSRAAYLAAVASGLYLVYQRRVASRYVLTRVAAWWQLTGATLATALVAMGLYSLRPSSGQGRLFVWKICGQLFQHHRAWGTGYHSFQGVFGPRQIAYFTGPLATPQEVWLAGNGEFAFNEWLSTVVELGIVGGIILTLLIGVSLLGTEKRPIPLCTTALGARAAVVAWCVFATFSYPQAVFTLQQQLFLSLAILAFHGKVLVWETANQRVNKNAYKIALWGITSALGISTAWYGYLLYQWHTARALLVGNRFEEAQFYYALNYKFLQGEAEYLLEYGESLIRTNRSLAAAHILELAATHAASVGTYSVLGALYTKLGNYPKAETSFRNAAFMMPHLMYTRFDLYTFYRYQNRTEEAKSVALDIMRMSSKIPNTRADYYHSQVDLYLRDNAKTR